MIKTLYRSTTIIACCFFVFLLGCRHDKHPVVVSAHPVFAKDIAPIFAKRCATCHRSGSAGPFSLNTYNDVRKKLKTIRKVLEEGIMPPWPADTGYSRFRDEKIITQDEKSMILKWISEGAAPGDTPVALPAIPPLSLLGKPDYTVVMDTFFIPATTKIIL
jgi:hypothetical protein